MSLDMPFTGPIQPQFSTGAALADATPPPTRPDDAGPPGGEPVNDLDIVDELQTSYLTYAMSVIVSRALPDVRDGLKPSQRRILVAMNDLGLGPDRRHQQVRRHRRRDDEALPPARRRVHLRHARPHGPGLEHALPAHPRRRATSARSPACRPPPMRYTEARLSPVAAEMLADLERDTVDFIDNYDGKYREPLVLPSKFPNLLVNGSDGIAVGMATEIPPHNLARSATASSRSSTNPDVTLARADGDHPRPRLPHRRHHLRPAGHPRRLPHRPRQDHAPRPRRDRRGAGQAAADHHHARCPSRQTRNRAGRGDRRAGQGRADQGHHAASATSRAPAAASRSASSSTSSSDADPHLVLNQLYQFSPLQKTVSIILLALVDGRPRTLTLKEMLEEFLRPPRAGDPPADRVPAPRGQAARARPRRAAHRHLVARRGHPHLPHVAEPRRGQAAAAGHGGGRRA